MTRIFPRVLVITLLILAFIVPIANADTIIIGSNSNGSRHPFGMDLTSADATFPDFITLTKQHRSLRQS